MWPNPSLPPPCCGLRTQLRSNVRALKLMATVRHSALLLLCSLSGTAVAGTLVLSPNGYGDVQFGRSLAAAERKAKQVATPKKRERGCAFVQFSKYPGVQFMVEEGLVTRADAESSVKNSAGVSVGMSLLQVKALHPAIRIEPHKYEENSHYLILSTADSTAAIVFEESEGTITKVRAGKKPSVEYVEGCS
jgi:hypothetical protein